MKLFAVLLLTLPCWGQAVRGLQPRPSITPEEASVVTESVSNPGPLYIKAPYIITPVNRSHAITVTFPGIGGMLIERKSGRNRIVYCNIPLP